MKERPILFSGEMVRAILDGRKTQTRRIDKCMAKFLPVSTPDLSMLSTSKSGEKRLCATWYADNGKFTANWCPYGKRGDRLWVRETWAWYPAEYDILNVMYRSTAGDYDSAQFKELFERWRPSIHMPRWASRILLKITDIRVERLQDISGEDAFAEGMQIPVSNDKHPLLRLTGKISPGKFCDKHPNEWDLNDYARFEYANLWEKLNGTGSWEANPWVWVIEFDMPDIPF
ncbi:MAG: hypothetical protein GX776_02645 [Oxalobacter sp.]|nr:hypothetical protein [Oxalobacter sp.]